MPRTPAIRIEERKIDELELIEPILNDFARKINKSLVVSCPHGHIKVPYDGREYDLCVYFWSRPFEGEYSESHLSRAYGFLLRDSQRDCFCVDKDFPYPGTIISDQTGNEVALIVGKTLYILFDLPHHRGTSPDKILELILADYYLYLTDKEGFEKEIQSRLSRLPHERFVELYRRFLEEGIHEDKIEDFEDRISQLRTELSLAVRDRRISLEKKSKTLVNDEAVNDEAVNDEKIERIFERLCKLSATGKITVSEDMVVVPVGQIDIEFEGVVYDIGEFEVKIDLDDCSVLCVNKTRRVNRCYHPHVEDDGNCCLGDASYGIGVLLGDLELETVVLMMIEFLKSYSRWGAYHDAEIEEWPIKE